MKGRENTVTTQPSHSTLRELRGHFTQPVTGAVIGGIALILTLVAPFGSGETMRALPRFGYWLVMIVLTYASGYAVSAYCLTALPNRLSVTQSNLITAIANGVVVMAVVLGVNWALIGFVPSGQDALTLPLSVFVIGAVITLILQLVAKPSAAPAVTPSLPPILSRLPMEKRGALVAISVEDHYVRIRTDKGEEMILMRLADAIKEVGQTAGLQVHRSHWVATAAVTSAKRTGDRAILTMSQGADIPVSRTYVPAIKEAGLLPA